MAIAKNRIGSLKIGNKPQATAAGRKGSRPQGQLTARAFIGTFNQSVGNLSGKLIVYGLNSLKFGVEIRFRFW